MAEAERPEHDRRAGINIPMQDYVEALVEPVTSRIRAGDITLREHLERVIAEHKAYIDTIMREHDRLERARNAALQAVVDERWNRVEEQIHNMATVASEAVAQLRRERELVTQAQTEAVSKAQEATTLAINKAEQSTDKRFEALHMTIDRRFDTVAVNRQAIMEQINAMMPREVAETAFSDIRRSIGELTEKLSKLS
jgi:hypothetical protein